MLNWWKTFCLLLRVEMLNEEGLAHAEKTSGYPSEVTILKAEAQEGAYLRFHSIVLPIKLN